MALKIKEGNRIVEYAHSIVPIQCGNEFFPNIWKLQDIISASKCNILMEDFKKHQKAGRTILINYMGGWCFKTPDMEIVAAADSVSKRGEN